MKIVVNQCEVAYRGNGCSDDADDKKCEKIMDRIIIVICFIRNPGPLIYMRWVKYMKNRDKILNGPTCLGPTRLIANKPNLTLTLPNLTL